MIIISMHGASASALTWAAVGGLCWVQYRVHLPSKLAR
jgi:hypothetical protein